MKELPALLSQTTLILANFNFRMASNKSLNATCNLDRYLFCKMPAGALEVEVKVKNYMGKIHHAPRHSHPDRKVSCMGKS